MNNKPHIAVYQSTDPTRTTTIRNKYAAQMRKRFRVLRGLILDAIVTQDVFGIADGNNQAQPDQPLFTFIQANVDPRAFDFPRTSDKVEAFMQWLREQVDNEILEVSQDERIRIGDSIDSHWQNVYIEDTYKRGVQRAVYEMKKSGMDVPDINARGCIQAVLGLPMHVDRIGVLYTRTFNELKGVTDAMDQQISRVLAQGLADGDGPRLVAKKLNATITGSGTGQLGLTDTLGRYIPAQRRAEMIARTETIRAHHQGMIQEYRNYGLQGVHVQAELQTAGDDRVCWECSALQGKVYTLKEAENLIPVHPLCRCIVLPALPEEPVSGGEQPAIEPETYDIDFTEAIEKAPTKLDMAGVYMDMGYTTAEFQGLSLEDAAKLAKVSNWAIQRIAPIQGLTFKTTSSRKVFGVFEQRMKVINNKVVQDRTLRFSTGGHKTRDVCEKQQQSAKRNFSNR